MKYDFKLMDNNFFLCCIFGFALVLFACINSACPLLEMFACLFECFLLLVCLLVLLNHGGVSRISYAMLW